MIDQSLVLLGSNFIDLLWFKGGWFHIFAAKRKVVFTNFGGFPKTVLIIKLFYIKEICWYSINILISYKCSMCILTIRFMKNLWNNLNLFKLVCVNIHLYCWELWMNYFCEHIQYVLKTYGKSWLEAQYGI